MSILMMTVLAVMVSKTERVVTEIAQTHCTLFCNMHIFIYICMYVKYGNYSIGNFSQNWTVILVTLPYTLYIVQFNCTVR